MIGRPFLPRATLNLPNGKRFSVIADGLDDAHPYIGRAVLNGNPLDCASLRHDETMAGGELRFTMQAEPNKTWTTDRAQSPYSMSARQGGVCLAEAAPDISPRFTFR